MALCKECRLYSVTIDDLRRNYNDIGNEDDHFCMMYEDAIPEGMYNGPKDCPYFETTEVKQNGMQSS